MNRSRSVGLSLSCSKTRSSCVSIDSVTSGTSPTSPSACRSASVKPVDLLSLGSCRRSMPRLPVLEAGIGFSSEVSTSDCRTRTCERQQRERAHTLRAVDQGAFDICSGGGAGVERGVVPVAEFGPAVGVMQIDDDVGGVEQYDQVLREVGDCVYAQVGIAQQH